jgi:hypothetical protein
MCRLQDHIIAERKDQKINQRFIEFSHILKKVLIQFTK